MFDSLLVKTYAFSKVVSDYVLSKLPGGLEGEVAAYVQEVGSAICLILGQMIGLGIALTKLLVLLATPILIGLASQPKWWIATEIGLCLAAVAVHWLWKWVKRVWRRVAARWRRLMTRWRQLKLKYQRYKQRLDERWLILRRFYKRVLTSIAQKSRAAAAILPHAIFLVCIIALRRAAPLRIHYAMASPKLLATVLLTRVYSTDIALRAILAKNKPSALLTNEEQQDTEFVTPVFKRSGVHTTATKSAPLSSGSRALVKSLRGGDPEDTEEAVLQELKYWIVFAFERFCAGAIFVLPYGHAVAEKFGLEPFIDEARGLLLIWLQLPLGSTALAFDAVQSISHLLLPSLHIVKKRDNSSIFSRLSERTKSLRLAISRVLDLIPFISANLERYASIGLELLADTDAWIATLVGTLAFFTVGPIARFGALVVACLLPTIAALRICIRQDHHQRLMKPSSSPASTSSTTRANYRAHTYLAYFLVLAFLDLYC